MALPRRIIRQLREGTYRPSAVGKKSREAAKRLRERQAPPQGPDTPPLNLDSAVFARKQGFFRGEIKYNPRGSLKAIRESNSEREKYEALYMTEDEMRRYAGLASRAWANFEATGETSPYMRYDFLWYH